MKHWQKKLIKIVSPLLKRLEPDHGAAHSRVVFEWCSIFAKTYQKIDKDALFASAFVHDLGHLKLKNGKENRIGHHAHFSINLAKPLLLKAGVPKEKCALINKIVKIHEEKGGLLRKKASLEALIFHDADKMDSMGALGISRQFVYSGRVNKKFWDPDIPINYNLPWGGNFSAMHTILAHQLRHKFYTKKGKEIANGRKEYMRQFAKRFFQEWDFKK